MTKKPGNIVLLLLLSPLVMAVVKPLPLHDVRLLESRWYDNVRRDSAWICSFTAQQLLHSFRTTAGVYSAREGGYDVFEKMGGWESLDCDLRGHAVGHLLTAYAYAYASTHSEIYRLKGDSVVQGIRACQQALGTGYVSAFPEGLIDRNIAGQAVWAPWYTLHKVMAGMRAQAELCHNDTARAVLRDFTSWAENKLRNVPERARMLRNEFGGIAEPLPELRDYFYDAEKMEPLYAGNFDMKTLHCNTFLPKVMVECLKGDESNHMMADRFFREMVTHHCYASGSLSDKEHFFPPKEMSRHLSAYTGETCCTYNLMRLARQLYMLHPEDPIYMDYYERALINHILGQQDPESGMVHYFLPMLTGAYKLYSTRMNSFWCCVGTGFENPMRFTESIYFESEDTLFVNLFIPSRVEWQQAGMILRQETDFPRGEKTTLVIEKAPKRRLTLMVRTPGWTGNKQTYCTYSRRFKAGERIEVSLPMTIHQEYTPDSTRVAYLYGPVLLAARLGRVENPFSDATKHNDYYTFDYAVPDSLKKVAAPKKLKKNGQTGEFTDNNGLHLSPLYDIHHERYAVYFER